MSESMTMKQYRECCEQQCSEWLVACLAAPTSHMAEKHLECIRSVLMERSRLGGVLAQMR